MIDITKIKNEVNSSLDYAEKVWDDVAPEFINEDIVKSFSDGGKLVTTSIPGFPIIEEGKPKVGDFIALVLDIRNSTNHLMQRISPAKASQLERVLYEITAINTAGAMVVEHYKGGITEFLGDGFLALFKADEKKDVYPVYNAASFFLKRVLPEINNILNERYLLPPIEVGIGLAFSKSIITIVGYGANIHPKAIGECVYRASKLSNGSNQILIDDKLNLFWPTSEDGKLKFNPFESNKIDFKAYEIPI